MFSFFLIKNQIVTQVQNEKRKKKAGGEGARHEKELSSQSLPQQQPPVLPEKRQQPGVPPGLLEPAPGVEPPGGPARVLDPQMQKEIRGARDAGRVGGGGQQGPPDAPAAQSRVDSHVAEVGCVVGRVEREGPGAR